MRILLLALAALLAVPALAQSLPDWAEPSNPAQPPPPTAAAPDPPSTPAIVPIDGGLGLLALAGGAYAAARLRRRED